MAFNLFDGAMAFSNGVMEADKKNTKENLLIRGKELEAKRDAIIAMKKSKYEYDLNSYDKNKTKYDGLNSVSTKLNTGGFNYKDGADKGKVDTFALGDEFLRAKHGLDYYTKLKASKLGNEGDPTAWRAYVKSVGNNSDLKTSISNIDFKSRQTIESNYLDGLEKIESKYAGALKNAKNDSSLVNAILGKKKEEIASLTVDIESDKKDITTIDSASVKTDSVDVASTTETIEEENDGTLIYADSKDSIFIPKTYKDNFDNKIEKAKEINYSDKKYQTQFADTILTFIPKSEKDKYFTEDKDGNLKAKTAIINADVTIQSLIKNSLEDLNVEDTFATTGNKKSKIDFNENKRFDLAKAHVEDYGSWMSKDKLMDSATITNMFKSKSIALVVPSNSIINVNNSNLKGYDIDIGKVDRKGVGKVYREFIIGNAESRQKIEGGTLEENINYLQRQLETDNNGNNQFTLDAREVIANHLSQVQNNNGELTYPKLTVKKENSSSENATVNNTDNKKSTSEIKQEELSLGKSGNENNVRTIVTTINGEVKEIPLTEKNKKILDNVGISYSVEQDNMTGDGSIMEQEANKNEVKKIKPSDVGIGNPSGYFETLDSIKTILPNDMSGQEIMDKYNISFPINKFTIYKSSN
mgnify:FL=1|tara:strand:+ start:124 stop:2046 length:1923 start_codon:yes stop_codon:yes gene_type:complete